LQQDSELKYDVTPAIRLWPLIAEGVLGMGLAYFGYFILVARAGPGFASLYAFLVPVLGVLASAVAFGEPVTPEHAAGLATVLVGLLVLTQADALKAWGAKRMSSKDL
jgi:drug/metabolite transporter (DMT)-like permease